MGCGRSFTPPQTNNNQIDKLEAEAVPPTVAPGGVSLIDVSGGSQPYEVDVRPEDNKSGGANADSRSASHPSDGGTHVYFQYKAGPLGGKTDVVTVTDSDGGLVDVQVTVGESLSISPQLQQRAPLQTQSFAIRGGEAPYWVYIKSEGTDCAGSTSDAGPLEQLTAPDCVIVDGGQGSCIDSSGTLTVRSCGGGTDTITVYDQAGSKAEATVPVSEALRLQAAHGSTVPGGAVQLEAVGGVPPYIYSYTPRGDHSDGRVDVAGVFTAGPNANVVDELQVSDNVGASQTVSVEVESPSVVLPKGDTYQIVTGDFNGDGTQDVLAISDGVGLTADGPLMVLAIGSGSGFTGSRQFTLPFQQTQTLLGDFNGDGTTDVLLTDTRSETIAFGLELLAGRRDGSVDFLPEAFIPPNAVFSQLVQYDFSPDFGFGAKAYALSLTQLADGGVGQLTAISGDSSGKLSIATVMDIPQTGDGINEQLVTSKDYQGFEQVLLAFLPQAGSGCTASSQLEVVALAFADSGDGGIARDPVNDKQFCVPVPDPSSSTLMPVTFTNQTDFPDFVVSGNNGFGYSLALNDGTDHYQAQAFDGGGAYQDLFYDPVVRVNYLGSTSIGVETEVQIIWPDAVDRWFFPQDGGPFSLRSDGLVGSFEDVTSVDFDGDSRLDEFTIVTDGGQLKFLRGGRDAHLATGHSRALQGYSNMVGVADIDGDGTDDVLVTDDYSLRIFWGDHSQSLAVGPQSDLGFAVDDITRGKSGGWVALDDGSNPDYDQLRMQHISQVDGGMVVDEGVQQNASYVFLAPIDLGPGINDAVLLREFEYEPLGEGDTGPAGSYSGLAVHSGGRSVFVEDPLLDTSGIVGAVNIGSADGGSDLVMAHSDDLGNPGTLELYPFSPSDAGFWDPNPVDVANFDDSFLNPLVVTGVFPFASIQGGPVDRVLVAAGASDGQGGCQDTSSDTGEGTDAALYLYGVNGGHLTLLASGQYTVDFGDEPFDNFCDAQAVWRVQAVPVGGVMTLLVHDNHSLNSQSLDLNYAKTVWVDSSGFEFGILDVGPDTTDLTVGDLNGDGLPDVVSTTYEQEFQFSLTHADGTLY